MGLHRRPGTGVHMCMYMHTSARWGSLLTGRRSAASISGFRSLEVKERHTVGGRLQPATKPSSASTTDSCGWAAGASTFAGAGIAADAGVWTPPSSPFNSTRRQVRVG